MIRLASTLLKVILFASAILVLGNMIKWQGKTISDRIESQMSHSELSSGRIEKGAREILGQLKNKLSPEKKTNDHIPAADRQKLRQLLESLDQQQGKYKH